MAFRMSSATERPVAVARAASAVLVRSGKYRLLFFNPPTLST